MAEQELLVKINGEDNASAKIGGVEKSLDQLNREAKRAAFNSSKLGKAINQTGAKMTAFAARTKKTAVAINRTTSRIISAKNAMMGLGAVMAVNWAKNSMMEAAKFEGQLASLGPSLEETEARLRKVQKESGSIFSLQALVDAEAKMRSLGVELQITPTLLKNIAAKASAMNITTERALDSIAVGVSRQSNKWLDNLGIIISVDKANRDYAATLGDVNKELTENEKKMAFTAAVQKELEQSTNAIPESLRKTMAMTAAWDDAMLQLKRGLIDLAPVFTWAVNRFKDFQREVTQVARGIKNAWDTLIVPDLFGGEITKFLTKGRLAPAMGAHMAASPQFGGVARAFGKKRTELLTPFGADEGPKAPTPAADDKDPKKKKEDPFFKHAEKGLLKFNQANVKAVATTQKLNLEEKQALKMRGLKVAQALAAEGIEKKLLGFEVQRGELEFKLLLETNSAKKMQIQTELELLRISKEQAMVQSGREQDAMVWEQIGNALSHAAGAMGAFHKNAVAAVEIGSGLAGIMGQYTAGTLKSNEAIDAGIGVLGTGVASMIEGEREKAGVLALMETARGFATMATPWIAAGHFAAAAMFGAVAGGLVGGGGSAGAAGAKKETAEREKLSQSSKAGGQAQIVVNYNNGIVLGGKQTIGRAIAEATASVAKTGQMASAF